MSGVNWLGFLWLLASLPAFAGTEVPNWHERSEWETAFRQAGVNGTALIFDEGADRWLVHDDDAPRWTLHVKTGRSTQGAADGKIDCRLARA